MRIGFRRAARTAQPDLPCAARPAHEIASHFVSERCRFVVECTCGGRCETRYIDEALEWRELHEVLAPLADRLPA